MCIFKGKFYFILYESLDPLTSIFNLILVGSNLSSKTKIDDLFKKFIELLTIEWAIVGSFTFLDTSQLLSKFESNFVFKSGRFGLVKIKEEVVDNLVTGFSVQLTSGEIANVAAEAVSWVR